MQVRRLGFTPLKGCRHLGQDRIDLTAGGPVGDRVFCLLDAARERVLRSVDHPTLVRAEARWDGDTLAVTLPDGVATGRPAATGEAATVDYWGRATTVDVQDGPWADAFSALLGTPVTLARVRAPGDVVYGASVTVVTTGSLRLLADHLGREVDDARFRSTVLLDAEEPHVEETWVGRRLRLGEGELTIRSVVPRCAVVDTDPVTGVRDTPVLTALAGYRRREWEVPFGIDGVVSRPGAVRVGDAAEVERDE